MIKNLVQKILMLAALIILAAHTVPSIMNGSWQETSFLWELVLLAGLISITQLIFSRFKSDYYIIEVLVEYFAGCLMVGLAGFLFHWFTLDILWMVFLYVTPVYIIGYFLDLMRTKRDLDFINEKIKQRIERGINNEQRNDIS